MSQAVIFSSVIVLTELMSMLMAQCPGTVGPLSLPTSTTSIAQEAYRGCSRITEVTIPSGVTFIG